MILSINMMRDDEIICLCHGVTVGRIREAVARGAETFEEVQRMTGCARGCTLCADAVRRCVEQSTS